MPWYFPWSDSIKKRACRYLLQHYVGQFLQEKLTLDQLSVDLFNGKGIVKDVPLDVCALNELLEGANVPLEILDGFIHTISVSVPWSSLMQENCEVEVQGLEVVVAIKKNVDLGGSFTSESLPFSSMTTSLQLAQECLKDNEPNEEETTSQQTFDGLESFAQTIESVLSRIKVSFEDVLIRFEHLLRHKRSGVGLELHIERINYSDLSSDVSCGDQSSFDVYDPPTLANKQLKIFGLSLSMDEFHENSRTILRNTPYKPEPTSPPDSVTSSPPVSPYQSAIFNQSLMVKQLSQQSLLPPVVILSSAGKQEANVKWKVNPSSAGPKVEFSYFLGTLNALLSPKQLHVLLEMMEDINRMHDADPYSTKHEGMTNKPMKAGDFQRIEKELHEQMVNERKQHSKVDLWCAQFDNEADGPLSLASQGTATSEETFYSLTENGDEILNNESPLKANIFPGYTQGLVQKVSEAGIGPMGVSPSGDVRQNGLLMPKLSIPNPGLAAVPGLDDDNLTKAQLDLSGLSVTLLLQDPPSPTVIGQSRDDESKNHVLCKIADRFFDRMSSTAFGVKDLETIQKKFNDACLQSHLRCFLTTVSVSAELSSTSACQNVTTEVSVGTARLIECLVDDTNEKVKHNLTQVLSVSGSNENQSRMGNFVRVPKPSLKAKYKSIQRSCSPASIQGRHSVIPRTEIDVQLGDVEVEVDVTLIDRLHGVFYPTVASAGQPKPSSHYFASAPLHTDANEQALFSRTMNDGSSCEQKIQVHVQCSCFSASVRFPILDLRPPDVRVTPPLWQKRLRDEMCLIRCTDVTFETCLQDSQAAKTYELRFKTMDGYWKSNAKSAEDHFIHVSQRHSGNEDDENGFDFPRIVISTQPVSGPVLEEESSGDSSPDSLSDTCPMFKQEPSPFSSKPVMYDKEELVVPGDPSEMKEFQEKTSVFSKLHLELNFPEIDVNFQDPPFFELIYNRFGNDLLLWEPTPGPDSQQQDANAVLANTWIDFDVAARLKDGKNVQSTFQMCRSVINEDSYSSEEDDSDVSDQQKVIHTTEKKPSSSLALTLNSSKLRIAMFPRTKFENENGYGKILLHFENAQLFYVLDYKGQPNLCYISTQAQTCSLYHAVHVDDIERNMDDTVFVPGDLYPTIYESDSGVKVTGSKTSMDNNRAMLSLAVKSYWDMERNSKDIVVALSLCGGTLRHRMVNEGQVWILQMIDYFGVVDEEVVGFVPPVVVTMLHIHFWDCALYYRPIYIPYQVLITIEGFSISSNITVDSKTSILRFIIDNAVMLISNNQNETTNVVKDYVSVADVDLLELSINTVNDEEMKSPKRTLTLSNNIVHVRTCSDSLSAVLDIVRYIVSDGDLPIDTTVQSNHILNTDEGKEIVDDSPVEQRNAEDGCLHDLMSDAMDESLEDRPDFADGENEVLKDDTQSKTDVFHFPDESQIAASSPDGDIHPPGKEDFADEWSDEEFCILDHPEKEEDVVCDGPEVTSFCDEIKIIPDHFRIPVGGVDQLKPPSNFPTPLFCYTIKEMSVIWQLFGGSDFEARRNNKRRTRNNQYGQNTTDNDREYHEDDNVDDDPVVIGNHGNRKRSSSTRINWKTNGGESRDLNTLVEVQLNKVRFQYEDYPAETKQAWRQVLLVQDVEIRDRLSSSQINKFLYQYSTEARPRQTHSNMISIKMLGLRPDDGLSSQEGCLRVSLKPLRLNIDQDTLQFIINFCKDLSGTDDGNIHDSEPQVAMSMSTSQDISVDRNMEENSDAPIFFRLVEFSPDVPIRLDYHGKHGMDMGQRSLAGVLFAFAQLNCSEITLRRLCHRSGLMGFDRVLSYVLNEWANDIKKRQIPGILGGVGPTYSLVQLFQGVKDLFWLPVEQYRRDGRIMRGLQRGASSFTTSSAMAFIELTNKLVQVVHGAAEVAYDIVSPTENNLAPGSHGKLVRRRVNSEPADFRQGIANAYNVVTEGFGKTASNIVQVAKEEHENKGVTGAVGGVLRHIPSAVVQPIILATEATSNVLGGVRNQILPDARREAAEKWRVDE
ncbi:autophagy-related protein 2 homolog B-like [Dendronephthya gigantea]|uniref:autophagy-related protein 2 homolog B-like n=1 Tax=Dendronephthya gigantea TaxID=151771 RepID=UPI00106934F5|nr:autophagy-related protein 2 homolog B-like [Dendronephthya gigantea]